MKLICIKCPKGCELTIEGDIISGNQCMRGVDYAKEELISPKRIVTTLLKTQYGLVPVKSDKEVPKDQIFNVLNEIKKIKVNNVKIGDIVIKNCLNLGINIVVTGKEFVAFK